MQREKFSSRLGFLLISAGCAIGLGNVWRFPFITGQYGGAAFVLIYLFFLVILGLPIMVMEFSVGRASQKSAALSFDVLEPKGTKWHLYKYFAILGNYLLMMFYTTIGGWMLIYFLKTMKGDFVGKNPEQIKAAFGDLTANPWLMILFMLIVVAVGFFVCSFGLQKGVEKVNKTMMCSLFVIMLILVIRAVTLPGAVEGLKFYLLPDFSKIVENGIGNTIFAAMGQAFFTLSLGIGAIAIFGSYIGKDRTLTGESINVTLLDTLVAIIAGLIIFPSCFAFDVQPDSGPNLIFITLPNIFNAMPGGRIWGSLFFIFMAFAALTTIIAVFQNIIAMSTELTGCSQKKRYWLTESSSRCSPFHVCWALTPGAAFSLWGPAATLWIWKILLSATTCFPWGLSSTCCSVSPNTAGAGKILLPKPTLAKGSNSQNGFGFTSPIFFLSLCWLSLCKAIWPSFSQTFFKRNSKIGSAAALPFSIPSKFSKNFSKFATLIEGYLYIDQYS